MINVFIYFPFFQEYPLQLAYERSNTFAIQLTERRAVDERMMSLRMGFHPRLGKQSPIRILNRDVMGKIQEHLLKDYITMLEGWQPYR
jgi:hypothetical protein